MKCISFDSLYFMTFGQIKKTLRLIQIDCNINPEFSSLTTSVKGDSGYGYYQEERNCRMGQTNKSI